MLYSKRFDISFVEHTQGRSHTCAVLVEWDSPCNPTSITMSRCIIHLRKISKVTNMSVSCPNASSNKHIIVQSDYPGIWCLCQRLFPAVTETLEASPLKVRFKRKNLFDGFVKDCLNYAELCRCLFLGRAESLFQLSLANQNVLNKSLGKKVQ